MLQVEWFCWRSRVHLEVQRDFNFEWDYVIVYESCNFEKIATLFEHILPIFIRPLRRGLEAHASSGWDAGSSAHGQGASQCWKNLVRVLFWFTQAGGVKCILFSVNVYICMYRYIYIYVHRRGVCVYICVYIYIHTFVYMYLYLYIYIHICMNHGWWYIQRLSYSILWAPHLIVEAPISDRWVAYSIWMFPRMV